MEMTNAATPTRLNESLSIILNECLRLNAAIIEGEITEEHARVLVDALGHMTILAAALAGATAGVNILKDLEKWR